MQTPLIFLVLVMISTVTRGQNHTKDTLLFKYSRTYLIEEYNPIDKYVYYKFKGSGNNGQFFFIEKGELPSISAIKENCFKKYIENLDLKFKVLKGKGLNDMVLFDYFIDYTIIMRKNNRLIKMEPNHVIE